MPCFIAGSTKKIFIILAIYQSVTWGIFSSADTASFNYKIPKVKFFKEPILFSLISYLKDFNLFLNGFISLV